MQQPNVVLSARDLARLERLLDTLPARQGLNHPLQKELDRAEVLPLAHMPADVVCMHSRVRFRLLASGEEHCLTLVYPDEVKGDPSHISILAPVGSALIGLTVGDRISWPGPAAAPIEVEILAVTAPAEPDNPQ